MSETNPRIGRIGAFRARREGVAAALEGKTAVDCPYSVGGNYEERVKNHFWMRGWARATQAIERKRRRDAERA